MNFFKDEQVKQLKQDFSQWMDNGVVEQVAVLERLLQTNDVNNCILYEVAVDFLEILHDEAVRRLAKRCGMCE